MPRHVYPLNDYRFSETNKLFLDTNVWLCFYGNPRFRNPQVFDYRHAVDRINAAQCQVYVNSVVISEFVHVRINEELKDADCFWNLKAFRQSPAFAKAMAQITAQVKKILARCRYLNSSVDSPQAICEILADCQAGRMDYNDHIIARACAKHSLTLVTADADFAKFAKQKIAGEIIVVTGNPQSL